MAQLLVTLAAETATGNDDLFKSVNVETELACYYAEDKFAAVFLTGEEITSWLKNVSEHKYIMTRMDANTKAMRKVEAVFPVHRRHPTEGEHGSDEILLFC